MHTLMTKQNLQIRVTLPVGADMDTTRDFENTIYQLTMTGWRLVLDKALQFQAA